MMQLPNCISRVALHEACLTGAYLFWLRAFERPISQASGKRHFYIYAAAYLYNSRAVSGYKISDLLSESTLFSHYFFNLKAFFNSIGYYCAQFCSYGKIKKKSVPLQYASLDVSVNPM